MLVNDMLFEVAFACIHEAQVKPSLKRATVDIPELLSVIHSEGVTGLPEAPSPE